MEQFAKGASLIVENDRIREDLGVPIPTCRPVGEEHHNFKNVVIAYLLRITVRRAMVMGYEGRQR